MTIDTMSADRPYRYRVFGLLLVCDMALPDLERVRDRSDAPADISIGIDPVGDFPAGKSRPLLQVDERGATLTVHGVARYRIEEGRRVSVAPHATATERSIRLYLLGSVLGVIFHQRRILPLHASAILVDGRAIAFCGHSGIGKSTLVSHFAHRGYAILCDDICAVSFDPAGRPMARPGLPNTRLWRDAAERMGHDCDGLERAVDDRDKYHVPIASQATGGPFALGRVYILSDGRLDDQPPFTPIKGLAAVQAIMHETYRKVYLGPMGLRASSGIQAAGLAQHAEIVSFARRRGYDAFASEMESLEHHMKHG